MSGSEDSSARHNQAQPRRGPPPGRAPTGWGVTRAAFALTVTAAVVATATLLGVILLG